MDATVAFTVARPLGLFKVGVTAPLALLLALALLRAPVIRAGSHLALDARAACRLWRAHLRSPQRGSTTLLLALAAVSACAPSSCRRSAGTA